MAAVSDHVVIFDTDARVVYLNRAALSTTERPISQLVGHGFRELQPGAADFERNIRLAATGKAIRDESLVRLDSNGTRLFEYVLCPMVDAQGTIRGVVSVARDIEERKNVERRLRESEERYRLFSENLPLLAWTAVGSGDVDHVNQKWCAYTGLSVAESIGHGWERALHPDDLPLTRSAWERANQTKSFWMIEHRFRRQDGVYRWFLTRTDPLLDSRGNLVRWYGSTTDIEDQKLTAAKLEQAVKSREEVLSLVSHDLRNPLEAILMTIQLMKRAPNPAAIARKQMDLIEQAAWRMNALIKALLEIAKIEAGHFMLSEQEVCGRELLVETIELIRPLAGEKSIRLILDIGKEDFFVICDRDQLIRVFSNLIGNAIKFSPPDSEIRVGGTIEGNYAVFSVSDQGPGIPEKHLPYLFDRYWQAQKTAKQGAGLGLSIAKGIVEAHKGRIWVKSEFGKGSTFYFSVPIGGANSSAQRSAAA
jgi:PAS domain S-box-containing protein